MKRRPRGEVSELQARFLSRVGVHAREAKTLRITLVNPLPVPEKTMEVELNKQGELNPIDHSTPAQPAAKRVLRPRNDLTDRQKYQLYAWLEKRLGAGDFAPGVTNADVASLAHTALGCAVTEYNIRGALEVIGLALPVARKALTPEERFKKLAAIVNDLCDVLVVSGVMPGAVAAQIADLRAECQELLS